MTADPYARLDAAYLLGALDADERLPPAERRRTGTSPSPLAHPGAMAALVVTPVHATIALQPRSWGTEIDLGSWQLTPGLKVIFTSGTALTGTQIKNLQITRPSGPAILALGVARLFRTADR